MMQRPVETLQVTPLLKNLPPLLLVAVLIFILDQFTKWLIVQKLKTSDYIPVIDGFFNIHHVRNRGAAFGILQGQKMLLVVVTIAALGLIGYYYFHYRQSLWMRIGLGFLLGGALGNLIDRIRMGEVVDFLQFGLLPNYAWPTFNVADISVCVGTGMIFILFYLERNETQQPDEPNSV
ncbi:MAG: signal peptidase II [Candidatus Poribacteria bacterium]|jgi:signal peptidase II|nr:signal peptidase II [Candidatus Poribacteria bacterium]MDP6998268.1 signal peptidase II [Candidatus Poribacteria bacterium]